MNGCKFQKDAPGLPCAHYLKANPNEAGFCAKPNEFRCIEALKHYLPSFTQSGIKSFIQCRWKYYLQYILGWNIRDDKMPEPLMSGCIWDNFIDHYVSGTQFSMDEMEEKYHPSMYLKAKLQALMRAIKTFDIQFPAGTAQRQLFYRTKTDNLITGYTDIACEDSFAEIKLSARPDFYTKVENINLQCGTYFLAEPDFEHVDIMVFRLPGTRTGKGKYADESFKDYRMRIYGDILSRPSYYFIGYNKDTHTVGKRFYRGEFDLEEIANRYIMVEKDMRNCIDQDLWYKNDLACHIPAPCTFLPVKQSGVVSEKIYYNMDKKEAAGGMR